MYKTNMNKKKRKIFMMIIMIFIISILRISLNNNVALATEIGDKIYLERGEKGFFSIQKWNGSQWMYIIHSITNYIDEEGNSRIAYCVSPDLNGIGYIDGEFEGYDVNVKELLQDERLWRVYINGYPYKSAADLGVEYDEDAYLATKQAGFCIIRGYTVQDVRNLFRPGEGEVAGQNLEDIQRRGQKIINAMCKLVDIGYNGSQRKADFDNIKIQKVGEIIDNEKEYIVQEFEVVASGEDIQYKVESLQSFPDESFVTDLEGKEKNEFECEQHFKVKIPKKNIKGDINGCIVIKCKIKNYPVLYSECANGDYQNYVLCADEYSQDKEINFKFNVDSYKSELNIFKIDKDSECPISGVKFSIKYKENDENIGVYETDENGVIKLSNLKPGQIVIKEIDNNSQYVMNDEEVFVNLGYNEKKEIRIENELKKASIKIIKIDSKNNEIKIPNVIFEITDSKGRIVSTVTTDEKGEAMIENLPINDFYTVREIQANSMYELSDEPITVKLNENEIKTLTFKNKRKSSEAKLPRTGEKSDIKIYLIIISTFSAVVVGYLIYKKR